MEQPRVNELVTASARSLVEQNPKLFKTINKDQIYFLCSDSIRPRLSKKQENGNIFVEWPDSFISTTPLDYRFYQLFHEMSHISRNEVSGWDIDEPMHGKEFQDVFYNFCPEYFHHYERSYENEDREVYNMTPRETVEYFNNGGI